MRSAYPLPRLKGFTDRARFDVARNGPIRRQREAGGRLARNLDEREHVDLLRLAVFEDVEIASREVADNISLGVSHAGVDVDVVDFNLKGGRLRTLLTGRRGSELSHQYRNAEQT